MNKAVVLFSGGFDSMCLAVNVIESNKYDVVHLLYFNHGNRNIHAELPRVNHFAREMVRKYSGKVEIVLEVRNILLEFKETEVVGDEYANEYVPVRNLILISHATAYAELRDIRDIYFGAVDNSSAYYPDSSPLFVENANRLIGAMYGGNRQILAPYSSTTKMQVGFHILDISGEETLRYILANAVTCNNTFNEEPCNECGSCETYNLMKNTFSNLLNEIS